MTVETHTQTPNRTWITPFVFGVLLAVISLWFFGAFSSSSNNIESYCRGTDKVYANDDGDFQVLPASIDCTNNENGG